MVGRGTRSAIERAEIGNSQPKAARASALPDSHRGASRAAGQTDGRYLEITNRHTTTPAPCGAGRPRSRSGLHDTAPADRRGRSPGGVSPDEQGERRRNRWGDSASVCRAPRRAPAGPARAPTQWAPPGTTGRAGLARKSGWGPTPDRQADVRGQDCPASGGDAVGSDLRARLLRRLLWL